MRMTRRGLCGWFLTAGVLGVCGCGGNSNEREFLESAPPDKPPEDPEDQKVSHRRQRTLGNTKPAPKGTGRR